MTTTLDNTRIEKLEERFLRFPQVNVPLSHSFAPGVYLREVMMPKGTFVIGQKHKTEHFNVVLSGRASVIIDGVVQEIVAPCIFKSGCGVRKILYIHEDMRWATIHPTDETDVPTLEEMLVEKSEAFLTYEKEVKQLMQQLSKEDYFQAIKELGYTHKQVRSITENENDLCYLDKEYGVEVKESNLDGRGVFATMPFAAQDGVGPGRIGGMRTIIGRYTNHSICPNCYFRPETDGVFLFTKTEIKAGEELTVDYRQAFKANLESQRK